MAQSIPTFQTNNYRPHDPVEFKECTFLIEEMLADYPKNRIGNIAYCQDDSLLQEHYLDSPRYLSYPSVPIQPNNEKMSHTISMPGPLYKR